MKSKKQKKKVAESKKNIFYVVLLVLPFVIVFAANTYFTREDKTKDKTKSNSRYQTMIKKFGELPDYAYSSAQSLAGYKIALKKSSLLKKLKCYCYCESMGMDNLSECFIDKGQYNKHASQCDICNNEAIDADKWQREGISEKEIIKRINEKYGKT